MKNYFKAIVEYEKNSKSESLIIDYFADKKSILPKLYCEGKIQLPSFLLLKKLHAKYQNCCEKDRELTRLFKAGIYYSKLFYTKLIKLVIEARSSVINYEKEFEQRIQPLGQHLVNLITNIKYRLKVVESLSSKQVTINNETLNAWTRLFKRNYKILLAPYKICLNQFANIIYQITLVQSMRPGTAKILYYLFVTTLISFFWSINFFTLSNKVSPVALAFLNVVIGIAIVLLAIMSYPIGDFGEVDISGKNIVAYNYRVFFNNHSKNKILRLSAFNDNNDSRHVRVAGIESDHTL